MSNTEIHLREIYDGSFGLLDQIVEQQRGGMRIEEIGTITEIGHGVARIAGLPDVCADELLQIAGSHYGLAFNLLRNEVGCVLLDAAEGIHAGTEVRRTHRVFEIAVGPEVLGRIVDPVGRPLDHRGPITARRAQYR